MLAAILMNRANRTDRQPIPVLLTALRARYHHSHSVIHQFHEAYCSQGVHRLLACLFLNDKTHSIQQVSNEHYENRWTFPFQTAHLNRPSTRDGCAAQ